MGNVVPIVKGIDFIPPRPAARGNSLTRLWRRHPGWVAGGGALAVGAALVVPNLDFSQAPAETRCGVGVTDKGDGAIEVIEDAARDAKLTGKIGYGSNATNRITKLAGEDGLQPGHRFRMDFVGSTVVANSITEVGPLINSCRDLMSPSPSAPVSQLPLPAGSQS
jgi:hypothetical protein